MLSCTQTFQPETPFLASLLQQNGYKVSFAHEACDTMNPSTRIMIVDNDPTYLGLLAEVLRLHGYEVMAARDGEEALTMLHDTVVDFILSDISMPRMNGMNFHRHVRSDPRLKHVPFAWNSGYRELREVAEIDDPSIDLKFDKATTVPNLLFFLNHFAALRKKRSDEGRTAAC